MNEYEYRRKRMQGIFQDTLQCIAINDYLRKSVESSILATQVYDHQIGITRSPEENVHAEIEVVADTTFSRAGKLSGRIAVLNFANSVHPGGGVVRGARAQEESLCRSSNLYLVLNSQKMAELYYRKNREEAGEYGSDRVAYHPGIVVFKDDGAFPSMLDEKDWFKVDVLTCAAPNLGYWNTISDEDLYRIHITRGRRILEAAIANQAESLVLGAFGCGAFGNDPRIVAKAYKDLLLEEGYDRYFKKVVFAIKKDHNDVKGNLEWFEHVFAERDI